MGLGWKTSHRIQNFKSLEIQNFQSTTVVLLATSASTARGSGQRSNIGPESQDDEQLRLLFSSWSHAPSSSFRMLRASCSIPVVGHALKGVCHNYGHGWLSATRGWLMCSASEYNTSGWREERVGILTGGIRRPEEILCRTVYSSRCVEIGLCAIAAKNSWPRRCIRYSMMILSKAPLLLCSMSTIDSSPLEEWESRHWARHAWCRLSTLETGKCSESLHISHGCRVVWDLWLM